MSVSLVPLHAVTRGVLAAWGELATAAGEASPFCEPEFAVAAARHLPSGPRAHLLSATDADGMLFALPVVPLRSYRRLPVPTLSGWAHEHAFFGTPLARAGSEQQAWQQVIGALSRRRQACWLAVPSMAADGAVDAGLRAALEERWQPTPALGVHERAVVRRRSEATYLDDRLRGVHRKGLRRQRRRLGDSAGGDVELVEARGDANALEDFLRLEAAGWKGRSGTALAPAGHSGLVRDLLEAWGERVQVFRLRAGGQTVAAQVNLRAGRTSFCFKTAYDERYAAHSPGLLLMTDVMTAFHEDPSLDLLDSCAAPGHPMADRLFPDRRCLRTPVVPLTGSGVVATAALPAVRLYGRRPRRPREKP